MITDKDMVIHHDGTTAYLPGVKAAVLTGSDSVRLVSEPDAAPKDVLVDKLKDAPKVVPWGEDNDLPHQIVDKVYKLPQMTSNLWFNIVTSYGDGIRPVKVSYNDNNEKVMEPYTGNKEVNRFFEENDMEGYLLEQLTDMHWFFNVFPEIIFNKEETGKRKIVRIENKEATFSRWSEMNPDTYRIEWHYYYAYWGDKEPDGDERKVFATPVLNPKAPLRHLREIMKADAEKNWKLRRNRLTIGRQKKEKC